MSTTATYSIEVIQDIEAELSQPLFRGVPLGLTLNDIGFVELYLGHGDWSAATLWKNRLRRIKYFLRPNRLRRKLPSPSNHRILVTWLSASDRFAGLVFPILQSIGPDRCVLLCAKADMLSEAPAGVEAITWDQVMQYDVAAWRADYRRCRPEWLRRLSFLCRRHSFPRGAYDRLALQLLYSSQSVAGCLEWLPTFRPSAILTECDQLSACSCLILSARQLGIPTFTMVHGVLNERAVGYVPVLADKIFCWGELQRRQFLAEGEPPEKLVVTGCPRLTRELAVTQAEARTRLGLPIQRPVVLFGSTMVSKARRLDMAELFCVAMRKLDGVSAIVRLHPAEQIDIYAPAAKRHPNVRFFENGDATLDESLAAADIVVVLNSGLGSDALVKRRLTVVLDLPNQRLGHGVDLIERAGCPRATNADELAAAVRRLLFDENVRRNHAISAEKYVGELCAAFRADAARNITAEVTRRTVPDRKNTIASPRHSAQPEIGDNLERSK